MKILQSDNDTKFKDICLELLKFYDVKIINERSRTSRTQSLMKQTNEIVKTRMLAWKRVHESTR